MKRLLVALLVIVVLAVAAIAVLPFVIDPNTFRTTLEAQLAKALGRAVKLGNLKLAILQGNVSASDLSIAEDPVFKNGGEFVSAKSVAIGVDMPALILSRKLNVTSIEIVDPDIMLIQDASDKWNFSSLGGVAAKAPPAASGNIASTLQVQSIKITNGRVSVRQPGSAPLSLDQVNIAVTDFAAAAAFPFTIAARIQEATPISLDGKAGPINTDDVALTPLDTKVKLGKIDLVKAGFVNPSTPLRGLFSFDGSLKTDGKLASVQGTLEGDQLILAKGGKPAGRPVAVAFTLQHNLPKHAGVLERSDISIGSAKAALNGTYQLPLPSSKNEAAAVVHMKLNAPAMAINELEHMLPAFDVVLPDGSRLEGGTLAANLAFDGPADRLVTAGTIGVNNTKLAGFDLGSRLKTVATFAGIKLAPDTELQKAAAKIRMDPAFTKLDDIEIAVPDVGELGGAGTINAAHDLDFQMRANLHTGGPILSMVGIRGDAAIPFKIQGTSANPQFIPQIKDMAIQRLKNVTPNDVIDTVGKLTGRKSKEADDIGNAAGQILDLFKKKK